IPVPPSTVDVLCRSAILPKRLSCARTTPPKTRSTRARVLILLPALIIASHFITHDLAVRRFIRERNQCLRNILIRFIQELLFYRVTSPSRFTLSVEVND